MHDCDIHEIATELNARSDTYAIGGLQELRKVLKKFKKLPRKHIFSTQTIHDGYAFHHGGRRELQFNIGKDGPGDSILRHGIAFSFKTSKRLPTIEPLERRVPLFNEFLHLYPDEYADMRMWHKHERQSNWSDEYMPSPIPPERVKKGMFVFLGKCFPIDQLDYQRILTDFDRLLPLYRYVENAGSLPPTLVCEDPPFSFKPGHTGKPGQTTAHLVRDRIDVNLWHNVMQTQLYETLVSKYGKENVRTEHPSGVGTLIDVALRHPDSFWFYEIKTAHSPRACIREAIGQLLEYSYWPKTQEAAKLIVVGETPLDPEGEAYLSLLNKRFSLPVEYEHIVVPTKDKGA